MREQPKQTSATNFGFERPFDAGLNARQESLSMSEMIVAVFDTAAAAEAAVRDVEAARLPSLVVRRYTKDDPELRAYQAEQKPPQSFWSWLFGADSSAPEYQVYDRSIAEGGTVVTVTVDEGHAAHVIHLLNQHAPLDVEERAAEYGIASAPASTGTVGAAGVTDAGMASRMGTSAYDSESGATAKPAAGTASGTREEVIPLVEEQLQVGKRLVDRGTTRVRRYVVRRPVEESVTLRDEQVTIERRRPVAPGTPGVPEGAFEERTIEVRETAEEPVVSKTAQVAEEVVVRKNATEHTETVQDTVRREDVEVEKDSGQTNASRTAEPASGAPVPAAQQSMNR
jgi:uncharacterized protein (TIGR02271 family)